MIGVRSMDTKAIERATEHFAGLIREQLERVERMKKGEDWVDYSKIKPIIIGVCWGDGIGPYISRETQRILEFLLKPELESGKVVFKTSSPAISPISRAARPEKTITGMCFKRGSSRR